MNEHSPAKIIAPNGLELEIVAGIEHPHSPAAEKFLLTQVTSDDTPTSYAICCQIGVRPKAFFVAGHRVVWRALAALHDRGVAGVDLLKVREELLMTGQLEAVGGDGGLVAIVATVGAFGAVRFFAEHVKLLWDRRNMLTLAQEMREAAMNFETRETFVATATDIGERMVRLGRLTATRSLAEEIDLVKGEVTAAAENRVDKARWFSSGLPIFDEKCHPFTGGREDQLVVICGGSGDGKSVALRQLAGSALCQGKRVLSFSRETSTAGFIEMYVASRTDMDLLHPYLWRENLPKFQAECDRLKAEWADKLLFCVEQTPATPLQTVEDLIAHTHQFVNLRGQPDVILVDYWQLFGTREKRMNSSSDRCEFVSHQLQALVREMPGTTMFVAAQLNEEGLAAMREIRRDDNEKIIHTMPHRGMIRHSQAIYHDADRVIFLYRPPVDCRDVDQRSPAILQPEVWWYQDKRRRGGVNSVRTWFQKKFTRFVEVDRHASEAAESRDALSSGVVPKGGANKADWKKARGPKKS